MSQEKVTIVTDSASYMIDNEIGVTVVPAVSIFDGKEVVPDGQMSTEDFYAKIGHHEKLPTTAAPTPATYKETYEKLAEGGNLQILSIHLTDELSAICNNARIAAEELPENIKVEVYDSRQISAATGLSVEIAVELAAQGWSLEAIREHLENIAKNIGLIAALDTTEHAIKGGRISYIMGTLANILQIKPILRTVGGKLEIAGKARTMKKAKSQMIETVIEKAKTRGKGIKKVIVIHTNVPEQAEIFSQEIKVAFGDQVEINIAEAGNALGVQAGKGALGFAWLLEEI